MDNDNDNNSDNDSDSEYEIKRVIGKGNFGKVLLGISKSTGEKVAIKIIDKLKINKFYNKEHIRREINVMNQMDHLNIVKIYKIENELRKIKIIMEYCERGELYEYIVNKNRLNEEESAYYYFQLINGLDFIHSKNIVHRDLKPENLLITNNNILKIIDFGLSNYHDINKLLSTPCGSPSYASPEMVSGTKYNGILVDIWCTGIILFAMLAGYLPFEANDNYSLFKKIIKCEINYPTNISDNALDLMQKILVNDPSKRINISKIKKHPFYLKGKKIFGEIHKEYLKDLEKYIYPYYKDSKYKKIKNEEKYNNFFKKKKIYSINNNNEKKKYLYGNNKDENYSNYRKTVGYGSMKKNILCFNISIENNNKRKLYDDEDYFVKAKIFKKKNILKSKRKNCQNSQKFITKNNSDEVSKYIKPIISPINRNKKIIFDEKYLYNSFQTEKNLNFLEKYNSNLKTFRNSISPTNIYGPYKRPTLTERSISLKKVGIGLNNPRNITPSLNSLKMKNITLNSSSRLPEKNSIFINKLFNIKRNKNNNNLISSSYVYKHKTLNKSEIKDNNYIYEKKHQIFKNTIDITDNNEGRNNSNDLNIYYTLSNSQTMKKQIRNKILFLQELNNKLEENKERNSYTNIANINSINKSNANITNICNNRNDKKINCPYYYGKTLEIQDNKNKCNFIKKNIYKNNTNNNHEKELGFQNKNESQVNIPNNRIISQLFSKENELFKRPLKEKETLNNNSTENISESSKFLQNKKKKFNAFIFNNQINQLNIYKNGNNKNSYNLNKIYFYDNSHILKTEENELNRNTINKSKNEYNSNAITINNRCETENNDYQSISSNKRVIKKLLENKNLFRNLAINKHKRKKGNLANALNLKEENKNILLIKSKNKNKLVKNIHNYIIDKKSRDNTLPISIKNDDINNDNNIKKKKEYNKKNNVLNIYY